MSMPFDYFVVFAEMRTGSNFLEANLNALEDVACHGEAFNPVFIGYPNKTELLGVSYEERTTNPTKLINAIRYQAGALGGFRFFFDHDPRVLATVLEDSRCAKIILTRNPIDSYISLKIARSTGQWKLTDVRRRKDPGKIQFDAKEFQEHVSALQEFQLQLQRGLQTTGQTAFYLSYEDLQDVSVMNGVAKFLGVRGRLDALDSKLKPQNPSSIESKVANFEEISSALAELDRFNLNRTPSFEPRRNPAVPTYVVGAKAPLLFMPVHSGPEEQVMNWLAKLDGVSSDLLGHGMNQKDLRRWRRANSEHRSFTVVRHPVARAHHAFCSRILNDGPENFSRIRKVLRQVYKVPLPNKGAIDDSYDETAHRDAFKGFLTFLKANLAGQTNLRIDGNWASQFEVLRGFGELALPDMIVREDEMTSYLPALAMQVGRMDASEPLAAPDDVPHPLSSIYDTEIEEVVREIYARDYLNFGFENWS